VPISAALRQSPHFKVTVVANRWQRVGDLIGLALEPVPPAPEAGVLPPVSSGRSGANLPYFKEAINPNFLHLIQRENFFL